MINYFLLGLLIGSLLIWIVSTIYIFWLTKTHKEEVDSITAKYNREKADNTVLMTKIRVLQTEKDLEKAKNKVFKEAIDKYGDEILEETFKQYTEYLKNNN